MSPRAFYVKSEASQNRGQEKQGSGLLIGANGARRPGRLPVFKRDEGYAAFEEVFNQPRARSPISVIAW